MPRPSLLMATSSQQQLGLAIVRIVTGIVFVAHGAQKLFVYGFDGVAGAFAKMGVPMPGLLGPFVAVVEFVGGIALIIGLLSRIVAAGLAFDMLVAILLVHLSAGFFLPAGYEFALVLFASSLAIALAGPGSLSADAAIATRRSGPDVVS